MTRSAAADLSVFESHRALPLGVAEDRIHRVFFHADLDRLRCLGPRNSQ